MTRRRRRLLAAAAALAVFAGLLAARSCGEAPRTGPRRAAEDVGGSAAHDLPLPRRRHATRERAETSSPPAAVVDDARPVEAVATPDAGVDLEVIVREPTGRCVPGVVVSVGRDFGNDFDVELANPPLFGFEPADATKRPTDAAREGPRTTDASGRVRLDVAPSRALRLVAASDAWFGQADVAALTPGEPAEVVIDVVPAFRLSGRVVHEDGRPVPGARVHLGAPLPGRAPRQPHRLQVVDTDEDGRFRCDVHPVPDTRILVCYLMGNTMAGNAHRFLARVGAMDVELVAPRGTTVRGRCVDEEGAPLAGVRIRGFRPGTGEITFTGTEGRFAIPVPGDGGSLVFYLEGRVQTALRDLSGPAEGVDVGDVRIPRGGVVAGRVVDAQGRPLPGLTVQIVDPWTEHPAAGVTSGPDGAFRAEPIGPREHFALVWGARPGEPEGGVHCTFRFEGLRAGTTDALLAVPPGAWAHVEIRDPASDAPISFAKGVVTLTRDDGSGETPLHHVFETEPRSAFDVQFPDPGRYVVEFELPVSGKTDRRWITVGDEPLGTIVLTPR